MQSLIYSYYSSVGYPVGQQMNTVIENTQRMAHLFNSIEEFKGRKLQIFCRGSSGAILSSFLVASLHRDNYNSVQINHVKKDGEASHWGNSFIIESTDVVVIIDDFIASGETLIAINEHIQNSAINKGTIVKVNCLLLSHNYTEEELKHYLKFAPDYFIGRI